MNFKNKEWYTKSELINELFYDFSVLKDEEIVKALDDIDENDTDVANFGIFGEFIFSKKKERVLQWE